MNKVSSLVQKYRQAAWRVQRQWLGLALLIVVLVALVAGIYLSVSARGTLAGRQILILESEIADNQRKNADLETQLATANSTAVMEQHAEALGFHPANPDEIVYVAVPGYQPQTGIDLSSTKTQPSASIILPEYTQSLFEWFSDQIQSSSNLTGGR